MNQTYYDDDDARGAAPDNKGSSAPLFAAAAAASSSGRCGRLCLRRVLRMVVVQVKSKLSRRVTPTKLSRRARIAASAAS
mmetsp:Transcript_15166/g.33184  ORF Transcript_15166/g.33184 Transcript_15166/m.33184 type:complete len:80 (-) Transcript_15166:1419-1658(-)